VSAFVAVEITLLTS